MLKMSLEIAQGTYTQEMLRECEKIVYAMFQPSQLLGFYRAAVIENKGVRDLVLWTSANDPETCHAGTRADYRKFLQRTYPPLAPKLDLYKKSAHSFAKVPVDSDAFWLVITIPGQPIPVICALYALKYETSTDAEFSEALS